MMSFVDLSRSCDTLMRSHTVPFGQALRLSADNFCGLLRLFISLNSKPTRLSELSVIKLSNILPGYLMDIASVSDSSLYYICIWKEKRQKPVFLRLIIIN